MKTGDIVRLKSGGPAMTVSELPGTSDGTVMCQWFDVNGHYQKALFLEAVLEPTSEAEDLHTQIRLLKEQLHEVEEERNSLEAELLLERS